MSVFPSRSHTEALEAIASALRAGASCVVVTGASGVGKTTLCRALAAAGDDRTLLTAVFDVPRNAEDTLTRLLRDFGLIADREDGPTVSYSRHALASTAVRFLTSLKPLGAHVVVVVDDAERMDVDALAALDTLAREADVDGRLLRLVLVGQPPLEAQLKAPALAKLASRVGARVHLGPLDRSEVLPYLAHRAKAAGAENQPAPDLTPAMIDQVYAESGGIPSRVSFAAAHVHAGMEPPITAERQVTVWQLTSEESLVVATTESVRPVARWLSPALLVAALVATIWWWTSRPSAPPTVTAAQPAAGVPASPAAAESASTPGTVPPVAQATSGTGAVAPARADDATLGGEPPAVSSAGAGSFRITVASFRTAGRAEQIAAELQEQHFATTTRVDRSGPWHQVIAGPYASLGAAREAQRALARAGFPDTLVSPPSSAVGPEATSR